MWMVGHHGGIHGWQGAVSVGRARPTEVAVRPVHALLAALTGGAARGRSGDANVHAVQPAIQGGVVVIVSQHRALHTQNIHFKKSGKSEIPVVTALDNGLSSYQQQSISWTNGEGQELLVNHNWYGRYPLFSLPCFCFMSKYCTRELHPSPAHIREGKNLTSMSIFYRHLLHGTLHHLTIYNTMFSWYISQSCISQNWIYHSRMLQPIFWRSRVRHFSRNRGSSLDTIRGRQLFAKSAHCDSLCARLQETIVHEINSGTHAMRWSAMLGGALTPPLCRSVGSVNLVSM